MKKNILSVIFLLPIIVSNPGARFIAMEKTDGVLDGRIITFPLLLKVMSRMRFPIVSMGRMLRIIWFSFSHVAVEHTL